MRNRRWIAAVVTLMLAAVVTLASQTGIGREVSVPFHLQDGEEFTVGLHELLAHGQQLFMAVWTVQEGGGRPLTKGTGAPLSSSSDPLIFPRGFNRISAPDANSCAGCHNLPFVGGGGDIVANVFVLGQRFDFATFDASDFVPTRGGRDEIGQPILLNTVADSRNTLGMFGSGFIELLARDTTADLRAIRDVTGPAQCNLLMTKGVSFGTLCRNLDGSWNTAGVTGLGKASLTGNPPDLIIRPFHQAGRVVSLREFSNNAFNHHHGIQTTERFGSGVDSDGDGFVDEMTRADVTAVSLFQAVLGAPGRVIPNDPDIEQAVVLGEQRFGQSGCATCHIPALPLNSPVFSEPNPFNPPGNLQPADDAGLSVDLTRDDLPGPRLKRGPRGVVLVPAFTDLKLHDITSGPADPNCEALDMHEAPGSPGFFAGNCRFLTRKLWGVANEPPFFHHGMYTTLREAVLAHAGEALAAREAFQDLSTYEQDSVIEFLKTLQLLPPGTEHLIVDERGKMKIWPPRR